MGKFKIARLETETPFGVWLFIFSRPVEIEFQREKGWWKPSKLFEHVRIYRSEDLGPVSWGATKKEAWDAFGQMFAGDWFAHVTNMETNKNPDSRERAQQLLAVVDRVENLCKK